MRSVAAGRLVRTRPATLRKQLIELTPGAVVSGPTWPDTIVFVTAGEIQFECNNGTEHCFGQGAVLCFARLPVRALHNRGRDIARLLVVRRSTTG